MNNFDYYVSITYKRIIDEQAQVIIKKLVNKTIREFQSLKDGHTLLSADLGLENVWDEICVDAQLIGHTAHHDKYKRKVATFILDNLIPNLTKLEKKILWMQTYDFEEWLSDTEYSFCNTNRHYIDIPDKFLVSEIEDYLIDEIIYAAENYSNSKIEKYLY